MGVRRHWRWAALALVVVGAGAFLLLRGEDEPPELTRDAFVREANAVCAELAERNLDLPPPPVPYGPLAEPFFQEFADNVRAAAERLDGLNAPAGDDEQLASLVETLGLVETRAQEAAGAASVDQSSEVEALIDEIEPLAVQAAEAEQRLGVCPGRTSARISIGTVIGREGENPLTETGTLG